MPPHKITTLKQLNERNKNFYRHQSRLLMKRIADPVLFEIATREMKSELDRHVPAYYQKSLEQALSDAERSRQRPLADFSSKGGAVRKQDTLQELITHIVRNEPMIKQQNLLHKLRKEVGKGVIFAIVPADEASRTGAKICFFDCRGVKKESALSGLKDRLLRARIK